MPDNPKPKTKRAFLGGLLIGAVLGLVPGFGLGVYFLPILIAEEGASDEVAARATADALRIGEFRRDLADSDAAHWGEGRIALTEEHGKRFLTLRGEVSPGPDYKLYLAPRFVETEAAFLALKARAARVADIKAFKNFRVEVPAHIDSDAYPAVVVWCESFKEFITAAELRPAAGDGETP